jgi:hypothetical protein
VKSSPRAARADVTPLRAGPSCVCVALAVVGCTHTHSKVRKVQLEQRHTVSASRSRSASNPPQDYVAKCTNTRSERHRCSNSHQTASQETEQAAARHVNKGLSPLPARSLFCPAATTISIEPAQCTILTLVSASMCGRAPRSHDAWVHSCGGCRRAEGCHGTPHGNSSVCSS